MDDARSRIAQVAARLMAEHGIQDHALAKRKAVRELGLPPGQALPDNQTVDTALRDYRTLFAAESGEAELLALRHQALDAMQELHPFELCLVGGVANGALAQDGDIELELRLDSSKTFEQFLINEGIDYEARDRAGKATFLLYAEPANVLVRILPENAPTATRRNRDDTPARLTREQLQRLLGQTAP